MSKRSSARKQFFLKLVTGPNKFFFIASVLCLIFSFSMIATDLIYLSLKLKGVHVEETPFKRDLLKPTEIKKEKDLAAIIVEMSANPTLSPKKIQKVTIKFQNIGRDTWEKEGDRPVQLGLLPSQRRFSMFHEDRWPSIDRPARLEEKRVKPGEVGTFIFYLRGPRALRPGLYLEQMGLVKEEVAWFGSGEGTLTWQIFQKPTRLISVSNIFPQFFSEFTYQFNPRPIIAFDLLVLSLIFFAFSSVNRILPKIFLQDAPHWRVYAHSSGIIMLLLGGLLLVLSALIYREGQEIPTIELPLTLAFFFLVGATLLIALAWLGFPPSKNPDEK